MSLHGTLETFALPDVLGLLAATKKTGELRVVGTRTDGRVWLDGGQLVGTSVAGAPTPVDAVFELLRLRTGKFAFDADKPAASPEPPQPLEPVLAEAQARLSEWREIEAVIPSLDHGVTLAAKVSEPRVMVTGDQWRTLVAVASSVTVGRVVERLGEGEFGACRSLKHLVDAGLVVVGERLASAAPRPALAAEGPTSLTPDPAVPVAPPEPSAPEPSTPEPAIPVVSSVPVPEVAVVADEALPPVAAAPVPQSEPIVHVEPAVDPLRTDTATRGTGEVTPVLAADGTEPTAGPTAVPEAVKAAAPARPEVIEVQKGMSSTGKVTIAAVSESPAALVHEDLEPAPPAAPPTSTAETDALVEQLAALTSVAEKAEADPSGGQAAAPVADSPTAQAESAAEDDSETAAAEGEEPINRGLLLKFLSSVRT